MNNVFTWLFIHIYLTLNCTSTLRVSPGGSELLSSPLELVPRGQSVGITQQNMVGVFCSVCSWEGLRGCCVRCLEHPCRLTLEKQEEKLLHNTCCIANAISWPLIFSFFFPVCHYYGPCSISVIISFGAHTSLWNCLERENRSSFQNVLCLVTIYLGVIA